MSNDSNLVESPSDGETLTLEVEEAFDGSRIDQFLAKKLPALSRTHIQNVIKTHGFLIDDVRYFKSNVRIEREQSIEFEYLEPPRSQIEAKEVTFEVLFEDEDLIVINKPVGVMVHPGAGRTDPTLIEGVLHYLGTKVTFTEEEIETGRPGIVHRLDADTSGVMVIAKNLSCHRALSLQFQNRTILRVYKALVVGEFPEEQLFKSYLYRDPTHRTRYQSLEVEEYQGLPAQKKSSKKYRYAESYFKREVVFAAQCSLISCKLATGRTHQIRIHCKTLGYPILGDQVYGTNDVSKNHVNGKVSRQMLHAETLGFSHPRTGDKLAFSVDPPADFQEVIERLSSQT